MDKVHMLSQKNIITQEYRQKMELYTMRASIKEKGVVTIARFISGLSLEIRNRVKLLLYQDFHDLVQICIKIEQQILRRVIGRSSYFDSYPKRDLKGEASSPKKNQNITLPQA